eukprot:TRINITY_DN12658_c0_g3_i11.p7 TRINITY_DN12658_c0_g3~~TRINITY_DN12658_c0_g3_i11.p7  ORF type:complete len:107 (+),score=9.76 TRINITY_DN12658_c0_g3_i11:1280-1600(+)
MHKAKGKRNNTINTVFKTLRPSSQTEALIAVTQVILLRYRSFQPQQCEGPTTMQFSLPLTNATTAIRRSCFCLRCDANPSEQSRSKFCSERIVQYRADASYIMPPS